LNYAFLFELLWRRFSILLWVFSFSLFFISLRFPQRVFFALSDWSGYLFNGSYFLPQQALKRGGDGGAGVFPGFSRVFPARL